MKKEYCLYINQRNGELTLQINDCSDEREMELRKKYPTARVTYRDDVMEPCFRPGRPHEM